MSISRAAIAAAFSKTRPTLGIMSPSAATVDNNEDVMTTMNEFPVRRVFCIGRNYREHAIEMGHDPDKESPLFFMKPSDSLVSITANDNNIPYPSMTSNLHFEGELIVALGPTKTPSTVVPWAYGVGCDLTRRDLQADAKQRGRPWEMAKAFDWSAPCANLMMADDLHLNISASSSSNDNDWMGNLPQSAEFLNLELQTKVNGEVRQSAKLGQMIWSVTEIIQELERYWTLLPGDIIMTGTPEGVGPLNVGDSVEITCGPLAPCHFEITAE